MHKVEQRIVQELAKQPERDFSTTDLVKIIFDKDYEQVHKYVKNEQKDKDVEKIGKRQKARLHRKLLYHLNKLVEDKVLVVSRMEGKGEKYFSLNETSHKPEAKRVADSVFSLNARAPLTGIEQYQEQGLVKRFDAENWTTKINAIIIEPQNKSLGEIYQEITELYPAFNDVLAINNFETIIEREDVQQLSNFIKKANIDTKDYDKYINLIINLGNVKDSVKITDFANSFAQNNPGKIYLIIQANSKTLSGHTRFLKQLVKFFSEQTIKVNVQNIEKKYAPILIGRAGTYSFQDAEWKEYLETAKGKTIGVCCAETSVYIDVHRFMQDKRSPTELRELLMKTARALLIATSSLRKNSGLNFRQLNKMNGAHESKFFNYSHNYIRLWNYDAALNSEGFDNFLALLKSANEEIEEFCNAQETIFKSCGIPIRFKVALSSAFIRFDKEFMSKRAYRKVTIRSIKDFQEQGIHAYLENREQLSKVFKGGDRLRFFRAQNFTPEMIIEEINYLLEKIDVPLIAYDFSERKGELTLDNFMG